MKHYSLNACITLMNWYKDHWKGEITTLEEGCLGLGLVLLHAAPDKKTIVIREVYLNSQSSTHTIRMYNKIPKKYLNLLLKNGQ